METTINTTNECGSHYKYNDTTISLAASFGYADERLASAMQHNWLVSTMHDEWLASAMQRKWLVSTMHDERLASAM